MSVVGCAGQNEPGRDEDHVWSHSSGSRGDTKLGNPAALQEAGATPVSVWGHRYIFRLMACSWQSTADYTVLLP